MTPPSKPAPVASVTIPTRNRSEILRDSILSALRQTVPLEIIVLDDGSTDETPEMMRTEFPDIRYERLEGGNGPCVLRNLGARLATTDILFPIDDDSVMVDATTVEKTLAEFDDPRIGAVAIPFINVRENDIVQSEAPDSTGTYVCSAYLGASHALRRDLFLKFGGYHEQLFYMCEERDYCIRLLDHGYVVRLGAAPPIHHHASPIRNVWWQRMLQRRNDICHTYWDVPFPDLLYHLPGTIASGLLFGIRDRSLGRTIAGYFNAPAVCLRSWRERDPVKVRTYRLMRKLNREPHIPLEEIAPLLVPIES
jgi:glycosyltransferase involved in cell wall biosynthesis